MTAPTARSETQDDGAIRVMLVDDSAVVRGLLSRALEAEPGIRVTASVADGRMAIDTLRRRPVDVIVLDIEMPVMDGLTALPKLLEVSPNTPVIMASTLTQRNADISLRALRAGASDYLAKPSSGLALQSTESFRRELVAKVKALAPKAGRSATARPAPSALRGRAPEASARVARPAGLRPVPAGFRPRVIAVGSSTGGPQALFEVLGSLGGTVDLPVLITQHMPATFTAILAQHLSRHCGFDAAEARDGEAVTAGRVYVAPGDWHMTVERAAGGLRIRLLQTPPENFCRPSVDPMLRSLVGCCGAGVLAVILTGMGQDGLAGCRAVVEGGGAVIAQDEATSVVWGMPGAVATAGLASSILPIRDIGPAVRRAMTRAAA